MLKKLQEKQEQTEKLQRMRRGPPDPSIEEAAQASGSTTDARTERPMAVDGVPVNSPVPMPALSTLKGKCSRLISSFQPKKWSWRGISFGLVNEDNGPATNAAELPSPSSHDAAGSTATRRLKVTVEEVEDVSAEEPKEANYDAPIVPEAHWDPVIVSHFHIPRDKAHLVCRI